MLLAALVLGSAAWLRGAEYDEQYTLFLTAGTPRPVWPGAAFPAGLVQTIQAGHADLGTIARDLRRTDVHPPLYFWAVALWRRLAGDGLFAARMLSVGFSLGTLAAVWVLARQTGTPPHIAMLLTLGSYGFVYTGSIARGFALAQMLSVWGVACVLAARGRWRHALAAGALWGAATAANYLAVFVPVGVAGLALLLLPLREGVGGTGLRTVKLQRHRQTPTDPSPQPPPSRGGGVVVAGLGAFPFLALDLWFFAAQHDSRTGQFPPFHLVPGLARLAEYAAANMVGGLPLYVPAPYRPLVALALAALLAALAILVILRGRRNQIVLAVAALSPALGLLILGALFNNTPIELRYLSFSVPFIALLLAGLPRAVLLPLLALQAASIAGLVLRPETMQPARLTARAAASLVQDGVVLVPYGNDGVGIVGAFALESPPGIRLIAIHPDTPPPSGYRRVVLARMAQDEASRTAIATMAASLSGPCWRTGAEGFNVTAYERVCAGE